jgi:hypothetical protein
MSGSTGHSQFNSRLAELTAVALVASSTPRVGSTEGAAPHPAGAEADDIALSVTLDEHIFVDPYADHDYNGGGEFTYSGARAAHGLSIDPVLGLIDWAWGLPGTANAPAHALAGGLLIFTPSNLRVAEPVKGDRPYASLFFVSNGRRYVSPDSSVAYDSSLTLGELGLESADGVQRALHRLTNSPQPQGWDHQISAGGEPTARYSIARQALLGQDSLVGFDHMDLKWTTAASLGTVTEASIALNGRWGRIASPWWATTPEQSMYTLEPQPALPVVPAAISPELFTFGGVRFKVRAWNDFLEGQFRHSDLRYSPGEVNIALGEAWVGAELRTASGWELRYIMRWESPELRKGVDSRSFVWGSLEIQKSFGR